MDGIRVEVGKQVLLPVRRHDSAEPLAGLERDGPAPARRQGVRSRQEQRFVERRAPEPLHVAGEVGVFGPIVAHGSVGRLLYRRQFDRHFPVINGRGRHRGKRLHFAPEGGKVECALPRAARTVSRDDVLGLPPCRRPRRIVPFRAHQPDLLRRHDAGLQRDQAGGRLPVRIDEERVSGHAPLRVIRGVLVRILRPCVRGAERESVEARHRGIGAEPERLVVGAGHQRVGTALRAADVDCRLHPLLASRGQHGEAILVEMFQGLAVAVNADAVEVGCLSVTCRVNLEAGGRAADQLGDGAHLVRRTLVQRDVRVAQPPLRLQIRGEIDEERAPVSLEFRRAGKQLRAALLAVRAAPRRHVAPRTHRVTGDLRTDAVHAPHRDVSVEHGVVERP